MSAKKSTNGRSQKRQQQLFRLFERVAPALGGKLLDSIWFRLPQVSDKARRLRVELPEATQLELPFENGVIRGRSWSATGRSPADGPTVYLVHGWGGWGLQLAAFIPPLLDAGFQVIAFDAPSHGESAPGREGAQRSNLPELADAFQAVVAAYGPAYGVIAHSLGAPAVTLALRDGFSARRIVFLATATDFRDGLDQYQAHLGFGPRIRASFLRRFTRKFGPMESFAVTPMIDALVEERELPALQVFHDRSDRETAAAGSVRLVELWPGARLRLTDGLGHNRILRDPAVVSATAAFLSTERAVGAGEQAVQETMQG
ncbi:alpha/beta fold hydrolase [Streptomyces sp. SID13031]|uniref:alpha/beta fold hydrolase n=1 Tax=Streptomyces sp. SID13031 TaxID=2706046 RepID=UPI0013C5B2F4|nr:alpha/beta fold hydrolase [Streptomyces sp. SID13031]NEA31307.1 alpha/beta hydrolase [Streptomyces sp. SID13031]